MRQQQQQHPSRASRAVVQALREAFLRTDADLAGTEVGEVVGTTAVTAVLSQSELFIGHAGECRKECRSCAGACALACKGAGWQMQSSASVG
jgi:serine/threonine protein phosphatase PrpC